MHLLHPSGPSDNGRAHGGACPSPHHPTRTLSASTATTCCAGRRYRDRPAERRRSWRGLSRRRRTGGALCASWSRRCGGKAWLNRCGGAAGHRNIELHRAKSVCAQAFPASRDATRSERAPERAFEIGSESFRDRASMRDLSLNSNPDDALCALISPRGSRAPNSRQHVLARAGDRDDAHSGQAQAEKMSRDL